MKGRIYVILNVIANILFTLQFILTGYYFLSFPKRHCPHKYQIPIFLVLIVFISYILDLFIDNVFLNLLICILYIHWILCKIYAVSRRTLFVFFCIMYVIFSILNQMGHILVKSIFLLINYNVNDTTLKVIAFSIITVLLFLIGKLSKNKLKDRLQFMEKKYIALFLFVLLVNSVIISIFGDFVLQVYAGKNQLGFIFFYILVVIGSFFQLFLVIALILSRDAYRDKEALATQYLNDQKRHYEYLRFQERETRKFRHDLKDHMYILSTMYTKKNWEDFNNYIEEMDAKIKCFSNKISVNHEIADAILNKFYYEGQEQGILLAVHGHFPMECNISAFDLCTILSNLLSNAMYAQRECVSGKIDVTIRYTEQELTIIIENHYLQKIFQKDGVFQTQKADIFNHGFGLENVQECVEKNQGQIMFETEHGQFKVMLSLYYN